MSPINDAACLSTLTQPCFLEPGSSGVRALRFYPSDPAVALPAQPLRSQTLPPSSKPSAPPFGRRACAEQMTTVLPIHRIEERSKQFRHWVSWPSPYTQTRHVRGNRERR